MKQNIRLLLVEDEAIVGEAICALLEREEHITVVGDADTAEAGVRKARLLQPDVILLDFHLPDRSGVEVITELLQHLPNGRIVILTAYASESEIVAAFRAGAMGYVLKTQPISDLVRAVGQAAQGQTVLPPQIAQIVLRQVNRSVEPAAKPLLSEAERRVLDLVAHGFSNKDIARQLGVARMTVHVHMSNILSKLNLTNRTQAALYALKQGWVLLDKAPGQPDQAVKVSPVALHMAKLGNRTKAIELKQ